jgi:hypothetical protein
LLPDLPSEVLRPGLLCSPRLLCGPGPGLLREGLCGPLLREGSLLPRPSLLPDLPSEVLLHLVLLRSRPCRLRPGLLQMIACCGSHLTGCKCDPTSIT